MSFLSKYEIVQGTLRIVGSAIASASEVWNPIGTKVIECVDCGDGFIVREDYYKFPEGKGNVYKLSYTMKLLWVAELPVDTDTYANQIEYDGSSIRCASWEGYTCNLDLSSGKILSKVFTK